MGIMYVINFLLSVIPLDFLQTWVYVKNNRSMLATIIFHLFINIMQEKINMTPETKCIQTIFVVIAAIIIVVIEDVLLQGLKKYNTDFIRNGSSNRVPGNISLSFKNANGEMLLHRLDLMGIMVSTGSACDSTNTQMSHVLKAIKIPEEYGFGTIRISFNHENTEEDAKYIAESIGKILTTVTKAKLKRS